MLFSPTVPFSTFFRSFYFFRSLRWSRYTFCEVLFCAKKRFQLFQVQYCFYFSLLGLIPVASIWCRNHLRNITKEGPAAIGGQSEESESSKYRSEKLNKFTDRNKYLGLFKQTPIPRCKQRRSETLAKETGF